jgi:AcrR family transcriptional regulator
MSPRAADPELSGKLIETAARLLAEQGPVALTTRRLATEVGTSTMAVYTRFGGMDDLVRAGFRHLSESMSAVGTCGDPITDVMRLGMAYRANAHEHSHLYTAMFSGANLGGFSLTDDDRQHGRYTLDILVEAVIRGMESGRLRPGDAGAVAHNLWIGVHGLVTLELGGYLAEPYDADTCFRSQVTALVIGAGDDPAAAAASMTLAQQVESGTLAAG